VHVHQSWRLTKRFSSLSGSFAGLSPAKFLIRLFLRENFEAALESVRRKRAITLVLAAIAYKQR
jgi:hypothetical protein